jgi:hypothetical protein
MSILRYNCSTLALTAILYHDKSNQSTIHQVTINQWSPSLRMHFAFITIITVCLSEVSLHSCKITIEVQMKILNGKFERDCQLVQIVVSWNIRCSLFNEPWWEIAQQHTDPRLLNHARLSSPCATMNFGASYVIPLPGQAVTCYQLYGAPKGSYLEYHISVVAG